MSSHPRVFWWKCWIFFTLFLQASWVKQFEVSEWWMTTYGGGLTPNFAIDFALAAPQSLLEIMFGHVPEI